MSAYEFIKPPLFLALSSPPEHEPILASRLADFTTNKAEPRPSHKEWLQGEVARLLKARPGSWVDLIGHASALGGWDANMELSKRRLQQVEAAIRSAAPDFESFKEFPKGEAESGPLQSDNSPAFRSVEVLVYGPDVPKPAPPIVLTEKRLVYRESLEQRIMIRDNLDDDPPNPGLILSGMIQSSIAVNKRVREHPYEIADPDLGTVTASRSAEVDSSFILVSVTIYEVWKRYPLETHFLNRKSQTDITRRYTFTYGPGDWGQKVVVYFNKMYVDPNGRAAESHETFHVDQPPSYVDP